MRSIGRTIRIIGVVLILVGVIAALVQSCDWSNLPALSPGTYAPVPSYWGGDDDDTQPPPAVAPLPGNDDDGSDPGNYIPDYGVPSYDDSDWPSTDDDWGSDWDNGGDDWGSDWDSGDDWGSDWGESILLPVGRMIEEGGGRR